MSHESSIYESDIRRFVNPEVDKYSVWVYGSGNKLLVYDREMPNTVEIWFKFNKFSHLYWKMFEDECIDNIRGSFYYNFTKVKIFMISRLLHSTNFSDIPIEYGKDGRLTKESYECVMSIHPRIMRCIMNQIDVFPRKMKKDEEMEFEKQCYTLFGKGDGVQNPHPYITTYCNLVAFWDKFGLNYFDILRLPQELFRVLKQVLSFENSCKSEALSNSSKSSKSKSSGKKGNSISF